MHCSKCPYKTERKDHLQRHRLAKHSTDRPFRCNICPKTFTRSDHLLRHKYAVHARQQAFSCLLCQRAFNRSDHLRRHRELVHDEGCHQCDTCLGMRYSNIQLDSIRVCKKCYSKATGKSSRVEHQWARYILQRFHTPAMGEDTSLHALGGCSKRRPDLIFSSPELVVCCECDEHWHREHERLCEEARMSELAEELGTKVVFLRFNPDGEGPSRIQRFQIFLETLEATCSHPPEHPVSVKYLFYPKHAHNVTTRWPATHIL